MHPVLIIGLGNADQRYLKTRHNAGFWVLDAFAALVGVSFGNKPMGTFLHESRKVHLLKPKSYMNVVGQPVASVVHYYRLVPQQLLVVHDDLDLPVGRVRLKLAGGHGGHNGLRSLISHIGSSDFWRVRVGIGRPASTDQVSNYVLDCPSQLDFELIQQSIGRLCEQLPPILSGEWQSAMQTLHSDESL